MLTCGNLLTDRADARAGEVVERLAGGRGTRIERIVSHGQGSPPGFWYDQDEEEFVTVVAGRARLLIEGESEPRSLSAGDWIVLPPHCRHRVDWTAPDVPTVWVAVFYPEDRCQGSGIGSKQVF